MVIQKGSVSNLSLKTLFIANTRCQYLVQLGRRERDGFGNIDFVLVGGEKEECDESVLELGALLSWQLGTKPETQDSGCAHGAFSLSLSLTLE